MQIVRYILAAPFLLVGGAGVLLGIISLWVTPTEWDWFNSLFGGSFSSWLIFMGGAVVFSLGALIAGKIDDWM
jgi:hypothetical protein